MRVGLVDIGGTKILAGVSREGDRVEGLVTEPTVRHEAKEQLWRVLDSLKGEEGFDAVAMAVPGPFRREPPGLLEPPNQPAGWWNMDFQEIVGGRYGCSVYVENDANCAAIAEARWGAGRDFDTVAYYTVSTGIGSGLVRSGRLVKSSTDTEGGHQVVYPPNLPGSPPCHCGGRGCLEALVSGMALQARHGRPAEEIEDQGVWDDVGVWLGVAAVNARALTASGVVVFGGGVCHAWDKFAPSLVATVRKLAQIQGPPAIARAQIGPERNLMGALTLVREGYAA